MNAKHETRGPLDQIKGAVAAGAFLMGVMGGVVPDVHAQGPPTPNGARPSVAVEVEVKVIPLPTTAPLRGSCHQPAGQSAGQGCCVTSVALGGKILAASDRLQLARWEGNTAWWWGGSKRTRG